MAHHPLILAAVILGSMASVGGMMGCPKKSGDRGPFTDDRQAPQPTLAQLAQEAGVSFPPGAQLIGSARENGMDDLLRFKVQLPLAELPVRVDRTEVGPKWAPGAVRAPRIEARDLRARVSGRPPRRGWALLSSLVSTATAVPRTHTTYVARPLTRREPTFAERSSDFRKPGLRSERWRSGEASTCRAERWLRSRTSTVSGRRGMRQ